MKSFHGADKDSQHLPVTVKAHKGEPLADERQDSATYEPREGGLHRQLSRRAAFGAIGAAAAAVAVACGESPTSPSSTSSSETTTTSTNANCAVTPTETIGPYPSRTDMFRSDVRENRQGTPLTLTIKVVNVANACAAVAGADVEIWHVDAAGDYSQYGSQTAATFLRGIQTTNGSGEVTFTTIYPGWYQGRATHIHVEVTMNGRSIKVTQMAFPESINNAVHTSGVYSARGTNPMSNQSDGIFADSLSSELVTPAGSPSSGYSATFQVGVSV
jgi:protocatechuate 3,4-dioxygenase beta subunit